MEKISKVKKDSSINDYYFFDAEKYNQQEQVNDAYMEILNIFREAFSLIDITKIFKK